MKKAIYILISIMLIGGLILIAFSPDTLTLLITGIMWLLILAAVLIGILPLLAFMSGFKTGLSSIDRAGQVQTDSIWNAVEQIDPFFRQKILDGLFEDYREKVRIQRSNGQIMSDIDEYINEDTLALRNWNSVILQIPGTLTGLGILGTFIGLIIGISGIGFSSVEMALTSVESMLNGIEIAFYTSISGVILSIVFNIVYRLAWNLMVRELGLFTEEFHKSIVPPVDEQLRYRERREIKQILERLDRIPKNTGFSLGNTSASPQLHSSEGNEQILMPQILQGLKDGEFEFYLMPKYDITSRRLLGGEALVRWNHGKLGLVSPGVFIPVLEKNGYITKLDQYIWDKVCQTIRSWIDRGLRPLPISVNVSKTDVLAIDIGSFFTEQLKKYRIPPRCLDIEIAQNAYLQSHGALAELEALLRQNGFKVIMDGFNGDFIAHEGGENSGADTWKLDLRYFLQNNPSPGAIPDVFARAKKLQIDLAVEGIENMEQLQILRKSGCTEGQGYFFSRPLPVSEFEEMMTGESHEKKK